MQAPTIAANRSYEVTLKKINFLETFGNVSLEKKNRWDQAAAET
jgi:hypothetical protein